MKEVSQDLPADGKSKTVAIVAFAAAAVLGLGFAYQYNRSDELASALEASQAKNSTLTAREKIVASELSDARTEASAGKEQAGKLRNEIDLLAERLKATEQQAKANERALQATVSSLNEKLAEATAKADASSPQKTSESKPPTRVPASGDAKHEALLKHFIRISDDFTRPKVYWHAHLKDLYYGAASGGGAERSGLAKLTNLEANSDGNYGSDLSLNLKVLHQDEVLDFSDLYLFYQFLKSRDLGDTSLKCRVFWLEKGERKQADLVLPKPHLTAIKETFELAESFKQSKSQK